MHRFEKLKRSSIIGLLLLTIGLISGIYLVRKNQDISEKALETTPDSRFGTTIAQHFNHTIISQ